MLKLSVSIAAETAVGRIRRITKPLIKFAMAPIRGVFKPHPQGEQSVVTYGPGGPVPVNNFAGRLHVAWGHGAPVTSPGPPGEMALYHRTAETGMALPASRQLRNSSRIKCRFRILELGDHELPEAKASRPLLRLLRRRSPLNRPQLLGRAAANRRFQVDACG